MVLVAVLHAIDDKWGVHGALHLLVDHSTVVSAGQRLLCLYLTQSVLERCRLHVLIDSLLADTSRAHGRRGHIAVRHSRLHRQSVLLAEGGSWRADECRDGNLLRDRHKRQEIVVEHLL